MTHVQSFRLQVAAWPLSTFPSDIYRVANPQNTLRLAALSKFLSGFADWHSEGAERC
jgi:hypothetical protein